MRGVEVLGGHCALCQELLQETLGNLIIAQTHTCVQLDVSWLTAT